MILRFTLCSVAGVTAFLAAPSYAFTPSAYQRTAIASRSRTAVAASTTARPTSLNPDWDNDDFLSSLGGGKEDMEKANEKYYKQVETRQAMDEWRGRKFAEQQSQKAAPSQPVAQEDPKTQRDGPSPEFFKKMGLAGDQPSLTGQRPTQPPPPQQMKQPPPQIAQPPQPQQEMMQPPLQQHQQPPPQQQQQFFDQNGNPVAMPMVYDQNGNLVPFNPQQTQQPTTQPPLPPQANLRPLPGPVLVEPPLPAKTKGTDSPRPVGFNPDAYTMSNTADVYFAQLKQDSKVRKIARMSGDLDTANKVFVDDSVRQIKDSWNENPYTKEKNLAEARAEIEGTVRAQTLASDDGPQASSGISYKKKLEMMKTKRRGGGGAPAESAKPAASSAPPKMEPSVAAAAAAAPPKFDQPKVGASVPLKVGTAPPPKVEQPKVAETPKVGQQGAEAPQVTSTLPLAAAVPLAAKAAAATPPAASTDEDAVRGKVRTLQGLLLKHRGGPGFGAGRLSAPEAQRLEDTLEEVKGILRSEAGIADAEPTAASPTAQAVNSKPAAAQPIMASPPPPRPMPATPAVPAPVQAATLVSQSAAVGGPPDPLAGSVACVEAALRLYKESPPADRTAMVVPLREALMAAASASNKYIAESELRAHRAAIEAGPPAVGTASPVMGFPTTHAVTKSEEDATESVQPAAADWAENEKKLEDVYNALVQAGGEGGKLGLKNISGDEANALADKLVVMRGVLLDELNDGS